MSLPVCIICDVKTSDAAQSEKVNVQLSTLKSLPVLRTLVFCTSSAPVHAGAVCVTYEIMVTSQVCQTSQERPW